LIQKKIEEKGWINLANTFGGSRIFKSKGESSFKKKRQRKTGSATVSKDELTFSFFPVSHLSLFSLLKTLINIKLIRKN
jgi:hypothetical protein